MKVQGREGGTERAEEARKVGRLKWRERGEESEGAGEGRREGGTERAEEAQNGGRAKWREKGEESEGAGAGGSNRDGGGRKERREGHVEGVGRRE